MDEAISSLCDRLSKRQRQCLGLVGQGYTSKEIGRQLGLSPSTIDNHVRAALERLNMSDRAQAARLFRGSENAEPGEKPMGQFHNPHVSALKLPPLGGAINHMSIRRRVWHIVQIALLGIMGLAAAVITIAGLVNLFSR